MAGQQWMLYFTIALSWCFQAVSGAVISCNVRTDSTPMFGGPWKAGLNVADHEQIWQQFGDIKSLALFYNRDTGCLQGVSATHGTGASQQSVILGIDSEQGYPLLSQQLKLHALEMFQGLAHKSGKCIEYLRLTTNRGRILEIGNAASPQVLQAGATSLAGGFLAYMRGFTHIEPGAQQGPLQRLQLVWALRDCGGLPALGGIDGDELSLEAAHEAQVAGVHHTKYGSSLRDISDTTSHSSTAPTSVTAALEAGRMAFDASYNTSFSTQPAVATAAAIKPAAPCKPRMCSNGICPTSSCTLNAIGRDVIAMACFGTNSVLNPVLEMTVGNPCLNLACKLDRPNCNSAGLLGVGGFCTGRVTAMGPLKLHPVGRAFLGYPCIEHKGPILNLIPAGDRRTAKGTYVAKAWKVCDCINVVDLSDDTVAFNTSRSTGVEGDSWMSNLPKGSEQLSNFTIKPRAAASMLPTTPATQLLLAKLLNLFPSSEGSASSMFDAPTVLLQWINGLMTSQELPLMVVENDVMQALQTLLPDVALGLPCLMVFNASIPLFFGNTSASEIEDMPRPVLVPDAKEWPVHNLLPDITALPTVIVPKVLLEEGINVPSILLQHVTLPLVTQALYDVTSTSQASDMVPEGTWASLLDLGAAGAAQLDGLLPFFDFNVSLPRADKLAAAVAALLDTSAQQEAKYKAAVATSNFTEQFA